MIQVVEPIRRETVVPVSTDDAFKVFTTGMTEWWPSAPHRQRANRADRHRAARRWTLVHPS